MGKQEPEDAWTNRSVKIVSHSGEVVKTIKADVLWKNEDKYYPFEVEYNHRMLPCRRIFSNHDQPVPYYEAYL